MNEPRPASKIWLETDDGYVFGPGVYNLLVAIQEKGTLKEASQQLDMSYRYAWGLIKKAEEKLGASLIKAKKGGRQGGGSSRITNLGESYIKEFETLQKTWQVFKYKFDNSVKIEANVLSTQNQLVLRIDNDIIFPKKLDVYTGDRVIVRIMLENVKAI
jgi:molybdate transport repressor ModE-like protein